MRRFCVALAGALGVLLVWASMASAVTTSYCESSLRGGGSLAPDNDVKRVWDQLERANPGWNITQSYPIQWYALSGDGKGVLWRFVRAGGYVWDGPFVCYGSGSGYHDDDGWSV